MVSPQSDVVPLQDARRVPSPTSAPAVHPRRYTVRFEKVLRRVAGPGGEMTEPTAAPEPGSEFSRALHPLLNVDTRARCKDFSIDVAQVSMHRATTIALAVLDSNALSALTPSLEKAEIHEVADVASLGQ